MSKEPQDESEAKSGDLAIGPKQAEADLQFAEIVHPDGTTEQVAIRSERMWSGVLPRPEDFAKYAEVVPDAPERILKMAEAEQQHRIRMETEIVPAGVKGAERGQWLGASISIVALCLAVISFVLGAPWQLGVALVGVPVLGVAKSLVTAWKRTDD